MTSACILYYQYACVNSFQIIRMSTQIVKLNPGTQDLHRALNQISSKYNNSDLQITVIVKPKQSVHTQKLSQHDEQQDSSQFSVGNQLCAFQTAARNQPNNNNEDKDSDRVMSEKYFASHSFKDIDDNFNVFVSTKQILPDLVIMKKEKSKSKSSRPRRESIEGKVKINSGDKQSQIASQLDRKVPKKQRDSANISTSKTCQPELQRLPANEILQSKENREIKQKQQATKPEIPPLIKLSAKFPSQIKQSGVAKNSKHKSSKSQVESEQSIYSYGQSESQSIVESLFVVQDKLNDAIDFIRSNKIFQLEQYLYEFKTKYSYMSDRVQIKWRLLMAYCKEHRKEFQRASILYLQVLEMRQLQPKSLLIDAADIHHRLGICFTEIRKWNDGILSFSKALKLYKQSEKRTKYAQCMNNLGSLYLTAYQVSQAEQCFLISYEIKKHQYSQNSRKLISSLLNLYECNLLMRNYDQALHVLAETETVSLNLKENDMLKAGILRRKGKLLFLKGDLTSADQYYKQALGIVSTKYPYSLEYAELCNNLAIVKLQLNMIAQAKSLFDLALTRLNFYQSKDSLVIEKLKSNIELTDKMLAHQRSSSPSINSSDRQYKNVSQVRVNGPVETNIIQAFCEDYTI